MMPVMMLPTFTADPRAALRALRAGEYLFLRRTTHGKSYRVLQISEFDQAVDGQTAVVEIAGKDFTDKPNFYLTGLMTAMINAKVSNIGGRRTFIFEPTTGALPFFGRAFRVKGARHLGRLVADGPLGGMSARLSPAQNRRREKLHVEYVTPPEVEKERAEYRMLVAKLSGDLSRSATETKFAQNRMLVTEKENQRLRAMNRFLVHRIEGLGGTAPTSQEFDEFYGR